ncbi:Inner membrane protein YqaA [Thalassocella blandensis]|nr:Inner membrane protein YqaA [Thalassocella blandensis]
MSLLLLFISAFLAATIVPFYSEVLLASLVLQGEPLFLLWCVATLGNTLGAGVNWILGRYLLHYQEKRWFPFKQQSLARAQGWFQRYGKWSLLFAWLPIGGDALTFIAGMMRIRLVTLLVLTGIGKGLRYAITIGIILAATPALS